MSVLHSHCWPEVPVPVLPESLTAPTSAEFSALLPAHRAVTPSHPLGCHRRRGPDRIVFDHVAAALVHGSGYEPIVSPGCADPTIGPDLEAFAVDGCITKASEARRPDDPRWIAANKGSSARR